MRLAALLIITSTLLSATYAAPIPTRNDLELYARVDRVELFSRQPDSDKDKQGKKKNQTPPKDEPPPRQTRTTNPRQDKPAKIPAVQPDFSYTGLPGSSTKPVRAGRPAVAPTLNPPGSRPGTSSAPDALGGHSSPPLRPMPILDLKNQYYAGNKEWPAIPTAAWPGNSGLSRPQQTPQNPPVEPGKRKRATDELETSQKRLKASSDTPTPLNLPPDWHPFLGGAMQSSNLHNPLRGDQPYSLPWSGNSPKPGPSHTTPPRMPSESPDPMRNTTPSHGSQGGLDNSVTSDNSKKSPLFTPSPSPNSSPRDK